MPLRRVLTDQFLENPERDTARYRLTRLVFDEVNQRRRYTQWLEPQLRVVRLGSAAVEGQDFTRYVVRDSEVGRLDLVAYRAYGEIDEDHVHLWWVIAMVNNIGNPMLEMVPGQQLLIPNLEDVIATLTPEG